MWPASLVTLVSPSVRGGTWRFRMFVPMVWMSFSDPAEMTVGSQLTPPDGHGDDADPNTAVAAFVLYVQPVASLPIGSNGSFEVAPGFVYGRPWISVFV